MTTSDSAESAVPQGWIARRPVTAFFIFAYAGTWLLDMPMVVGQDGLGLFAYSTPLPVYVVLFVLSSFAGPCLGGVLVTHAAEGRAGVRRLARRAALWRVGWLPWLIVLFGYPLLYVMMSAVVIGAAPLRALAANPATFVTAYLPALIIFPGLITWGEEPGWRGVALTRLQPVVGPLPATLIVGFAHAVWHLPIFLLVKGPPALGPFQLSHFALNTVVIVVVSVIWTGVFNRARQSILIAVLLHASLNATGGWFGQLVPDAPDTVGYALYVLYGATALALVIVTRGRLGYAREPSA